MTDLGGMLVVSLEQAVAAPLASLRLADAGARVIKVERPEGDFARDYDQLVKGQSAYFVWLNRGKESVCLDLKSEHDAALMEALIADADVFIQNLAPGAVARLGLDPKRLIHDHKRLVCCTISGYGDRGPYRNHKAYDMLVQAESGLIAVNGSEHDPARVGISVCDIAAGTTAHGAILQALFARERTGRGRAIEVSLFHALADWMNVPYLQTRYGDRPPGRMGVRHPTIAPYGSFLCADGKSVVLSIQNQREWRRLCASVLDKPELADDPRFRTNSDRFENAATLDAIIAGRLSGLTREAAVDQLRAAGIACSRLSDMDDLVAHPQHRIVTTVTEGGEVELLAPGAWEAKTTSVTGAVPALGEHTDRIRDEFLPERLAAQS